MVSLDHTIRRRLGYDRSPTLQDRVHPLDISHDQNAADNPVKGYGQGNGQDGSEKIAKSRTLGQSPKQIMACNVQSIGQGHDGIEHDRVGGGVDPQSLVQKQVLDQIIQQRDGKPRKKQGISDAVPAHIAVPAQQG
jgi:hypothetical protein